MGGGRAQPGAARSTTGRSPSWSSSGRLSVAPRSRYTLLAGPDAGARVGRGERAGAAPTTITAHVTVAPDGGPVRGRAGRAGLGARRLVLPPAGRRGRADRWSTCTTWPAGALYRVEARIGAARPRRPHAGVPLRPARADAARRRRRGRRRRDPPHRLEPLLAHRRRAHRRLVTGLLTRRRGLPGPLRASPARCTASTSTCPGNRSSTPKREAEAIIASQ